LSDLEKGFNGQLQVEQGIEEEFEETTYDKVFETSKTYVHIRISLSEPVVPVPTKAEPTPAEVVPVK
jgi:hypothetical protein